MAVWKSDDHQLSWIHGLAQFIFKWQMQIYTYWFLVDAHQNILWLNESIDLLTAVSGYRNIPNIGIDSLSSKYGILVFTILVSSSAFRGCSVHSTFGNERNGQAYLLILILSFKLMMLLMYHYICFWTNNKLHSDMWEWWTNPVQNIGNISYVVKKWSCDFHEMMTMVLIRECRVRWWNQKSFSPSTMKLAKP